MTRQPYKEGEWASNCESGYGPGDPLNRLCVKGNPPYTSPGQVTEPSTSIHQLIADYINDARRNVSPDAANMKAVVR